MVAVRFVINSTISAVQIFLLASLLPFGCSGISKRGMVTCDRGLISRVVMQKLRSLFLYVCIK